VQVGIVSPHSGSATTTAWQGSPLGEGADGDRFGCLADGELATTADVCEGFLELACLLACSNDIVMSSS
jgi:hypothetical protein